MVTCLPRVLVLFSLYPTFFIVSFSSHHGFHFPNRSSAYPRETLRAGCKKSCATTAPAGDNRIDVSPPHLNSRCTAGAFPVAVQPLLEPDPSRSGCSPVEGPLGLQFSKARLQHEAPLIGAMPATLHTPQLYTPRDCFCTTRPKF
jgi:hypothetical protein